MALQRAAHRFGHRGGDGVGRCARVFEAPLMQEDDLVPFAACQRKLAGLTEVVPLQMAADERRQPGRFAPSGRRVPRSQRQHGRFDQMRFGFEHLGEPDTLIFHHRRIEDADRNGRRRGDQDDHHADKQDDGTEFARLQRATHMPSRPRSYVQRSSRSGGSSGVRLFHASMLSSFGMKRDAEVLPSDIPRRSLTFC